MLKSKVRSPLLNVHLGFGQSGRNHKGGEQILITRLTTDYTFHAYGRTEGVCGIIISDHEYPALVAHQLLSKVMDEFLAAHPRSAWASAGPNSITMPELKEYLVKYQDPHQADSIMKIQKELDETKIVLHKTIESVLQRGEKIDDLVAKSDGLSNQSKMFYRKQQSPPPTTSYHYIRYGVEDGNKD